MRKSRVSLVGALTLAMAAGIFLVAPPAFAQVVTGSILGTVTDSSSAVVPGAKITITETDTNTSRVINTDPAGSYSVTDLPPGPYKVSAEKEGFKVGVQTGIQLFAAQTSRVDIVLQPGTVTQSVTVAGGAAPQLQTDTAETGRAIDTTMVQDLPLSTGHNFQNLLSLVPGNEPALRQHSIFYNSQNGMSSPANGVPGRGNFSSIEGLDNNQRSGELPVYIPAMEAIQEVAITASNYDPAQGTALGSVSNVIIKSGGNTVHGEAYEFYTGSRLDARNYFALGTVGGTKPYHVGHSVDNYFGGNIGGAIKKDKLFYFADFFYHPTVTNNFYPLSVPTPDIIEGNFTNPYYTSPVSAGGLGLILYDPTTGDTADCLPGGVNAKTACGSGRQQVGTVASVYNGGAPNMVAVDPVAKALFNGAVAHGLHCTNCTTTVPLLNGVPNVVVPNLVNNLPLNSPIIQNTKDLDVKFDYYLTEHDHFSVRSSWQDVYTDQAAPWGPYGGPISLGGTTGAEGTSTNVITSEGVNWVHVFSPTLLTEVRFGANRYNNLAYQNAYGQNLSTQVGVPGLDYNKNSSGLFSVTGEGFSDPLFGAFSSLPWIHAQTNIVFVDNTTMVRGNHTLEMGLDYYRMRDDYIYAANQFGSFGFGPGPTELNGTYPTGFTANNPDSLNSFADFLMGIPISANQGVIYHYPSYRQNQFFPYFGDKWQATKKLTVNAGLRWEYYGPPTTHFPGDMANYDIYDNNLEVNGYGNIPMNLGVNRDLGDWAPRVGLAYRLTNHDVLRAGFGMSSMAYPLDIYMSLNYPTTTAYSWNQYQSNSFGPDIVGSVGGSFEGGFPAVPPANIPSNGIIPVTGNAALTGATMYYVPRDWKHPYVMSWNFAYERTLPGGWNLDVAYVGNRTVRASMYNNINASTQYGCTAACQPEYPTYGRTAATEIFFAQSRGAYDSLQIKLDHHFKHNFSATSSYTWGKALGPSGEGSDYVTGYLDYVNTKRDWAPTDFNVASMYSQSVIWYLPFGADKAFLQHGVGAAVLGGWELSGSWFAHTGFPINFAGSATFNTPGSSESPNETGPFTVTHGVSSHDSTVHWFNTGVFSNPAVGTQGTMGYYTYQGPGFFALNADLSRTFKITERFKLLLRTEWLNATNTPQFGNPGATVGSSSFGRVTGTAGTGGVRNINLVGKLIF